MRLPGCPVAGAVAFTLPRRSRRSTRLHHQRDRAPTYAFPNAQAALDYGYGLCGRIEARTSYADMARQIRDDFNTDDEFTVSYLLSQAAQELCPAQTWQLRRGRGLPAGIVARATHSVTKSLRLEA